MALHRLAALVAPLVTLLILTPLTALAQAQAPATPAAAPSGDQLLKPEGSMRSSRRSRCTRIHCCRWS